MNQTCPHCGNDIESKSRWEPLNPGLVRCLIQGVVAVHRKNQNRFHLQRDLVLTKTQYNNFQKLRYHALIAHADPQNPKSGEWLITSRGGQFLRGEITVPRKVLVTANHVADHSKELVHINEMKNRLPEFDPKYAYIPQLMPPKSDQTMPLFVTPKH